MPELNLWGHQSTNDSSKHQLSAAVLYAKKTVISIIFYDLKYWTESQVSSSSFGKIVHSVIILVLYSKKYFTKMRHIAIIFPISRLSFFGFYITIYSFITVYFLFSLLIKPFWNGDFGGIYLLIIETFFVWG